MTTRHPEHGPAGDGVPPLRFVGAAGGPRLHHSRVAVSVDAEFRQLLMLRAVGETVALVTDFPLDAVVDLRVALDEVATRLISAAVRDSVLGCEFDADAEGITVRLHTVVEVDDPLDEAGFSWHILRAITDHLTVRNHPYDAAVAGHPVEVVFGRRRAGHPER
ncbi:anti-sigma factor [Nocardia thailandica]